MLPIIFVAVAAVMAMHRARASRGRSCEFEPLEAYRLDIAGSICGIVGLLVLSFLRAPPVAWGVVAAVLFVGAALRAATSGVRCRWWRWSALVFVLGRESIGAECSWSPYYRVER